MSRSARSQSAGSPIALSGFVAKLNRGFSPNQPVGLVDLAEHRPDLVHELVGPNVDVGVVLDELAHPRQAGERAGALVPVQPPELAVAERQVAVRPPLASGR